MFSQTHHPLTMVPYAEFGDLRAGVHLGVCRTCNFFFFNKNLNRISQFTPNCQCGQGSDT